MWDDTGMRQGGRGSNVNRPNIIIIIIIIFIAPYLQRPLLVGHPQGTVKWPPLINCLRDGPWWG